MDIGKTVKIIEDEPAPVKVPQVLPATKDPLETPVEVPDERELVPVPIRKQ